MCVCNWRFASNKIVLLSFTSIQFVCVCVFLLFFMLFCPLFQPQFMCPIINFHFFVTIQIMNLVRCRIFFPCVVLYLLAVFPISFRIFFLLVLLLFSSPFSLMLPCSHLICVQFDIVKIVCSPIIFSFPAVILLPNYRLLLNIYTHKVCFQFFFFDA